MDFGQIEPFISEYQDLSPAFGNCHSQLHSLSQNFTGTTQTSTEIVPRPVIEISIKETNFWAGGADSIFQSQLFNKVEMTLKFLLTGSVYLSRI